MNRASCVDWEKTESWKWPDSYENIVGVFLPSDWTKTNPLHMSDVSTQCHIWQQCREFRLNKTTVKNARAARNANFHNSSFEVSDTEKAKAFDALKDVIKDPDIRNDIDVNECLCELDNIFKDDFFCSKDESILEKIAAVSQENQGSFERRINEICDHLLAIEEENRFSVTVMEILASRIDTLDRRFRTIMKYPKYAIVMTFLCFMWMYLPNPIPFQGNVPQWQGKIFNFSFKQT